jgi:hypothetical protein
MPSDDRVDGWVPAHVGGGPGKHRAPRRHTLRTDAGPPSHHRARSAGPVPRIALVVTAVAAVLVGTGALAQTLPFRPIGLPSPDDDDSAAPASTGTGAEDSQRGAAASGSPPITPTPGSAPDEAVPEAGPTAAPTDPPATPEPPAEPVTVNYEAEAADLSGFVQLFEVEAASGGDVVGMIGAQAASHVRFPEVTVDSPGEYELTFYYVSAPDRQAVVSVNDGEPVVLDFPGLGDPNEVGEVTVPVQLAAGPNAVWFGNADRPAPALDRITVTG